MREGADMVAWKKEFSKLKTEDHLSKLKELGLDDEDLDEFKALEKGEKTLEDELGPPVEEIEKPSLKHSTSASHPTGAGKKIKK